MAKAIGVDAKDKNTLSTLTDTITFGMMPIQASTTQTKKGDILPPKETKTETKSQRKGFANFLLSQ